MQGRASRRAVAVLSLGAIAGGTWATAVSAHQGPRTRSLARGIEPDRSRAAHLGRWTARVGRRVVREQPSRIGARKARRRRRALHARPHSDPLRLIPRARRPGHGRQPTHRRRVLRRRVPPRGAGSGNDIVRRQAARRRSHLRLARRPQPRIDRRRPGPRGAPRQHPRNDGNAADAARTVEAACRPEHVQGDLPARISAREHDLRRRQGTRAAHGMVGQAPRVRDPQRAVRQRRRRPVRARD